MWPLKEVKSPASVSKIKKKSTRILDPSVDPSLVILYDSYTYNLA